MILVIPNENVSAVEKGDKITEVFFNNTSMTPEQHNKLADFLDSLNLSSTAKDYAFEHVYKAVSLDFLLKCLR